MVRCTKQHKGKEKVVRARGKRMHRARTAWCTARTALTSPSMVVREDELVLTTMLLLKSDVRLEGAKQSHQFPDCVFGNQMRHCDRSSVQPKWCRRLYRPGFITPLESKSGTLIRGNLF